MQPVRSRVSATGAFLALVFLHAGPAAAQLRATQVVGGLTHPVAFVQDPGDPTIQYIVQQEGRIRVLRNGALQTALFLDLSASISTGGERGLLGLAMAPDYATSGRFFVNYTNLNGDTVVARFKRATTSPTVTADANSHLEMLWSTGQRFIAQPFANHNGGTIMFGPDGFLYIGMGDGGSGDDPQNNAQNMSSLLGKMLRIDVNVPDGDPKGFTIPASNPFGGSGTPEIWDVGVRNPWKYSFDNPSLGGTGALIIADVGQGTREEIDYEPAGAGGRNYGWRIREGLIANPDGIPATTPAFLPLVDPIFDYTHAVGQSITGGYVYRGTALGAGMVGRYFFGDFVAGKIWSLALTINGAGQATASDLREHTAELGSGGVSSFGVDASGELYFCNYNTATVWRIGSATSPPPTISAVSPSGGSIAGGAGITITGTGFQAGARVTLGGALATSVVVSSATSLTAITPSHALGVVNVTVTNPDQQSGTATAAFTYRTDSPGPFGSFDTPANGSTGVAGAIAVTGWALDDVLVTRVTVCRDYPAGSSGPLDPNCNTQSRVYVGDAVFVPGARSDVQAAFPSTPFNGRAGWGYMLLTNVLPNQGNGTFTFRAFAYDADGHVTELGAKTITCNNTGSTLPFGAIDTPGQGATASGAAFANFGWVLSPAPHRADPPHGTVHVLVDGVVVGDPAGWTSRPDLTALFPAAQYPGVTNALGVFGLDTTALSDGLHTIAWVVADDGSQQQGVGSRFFTVANGSGVAAQAFRPAPGGKPEAGSWKPEADSWKPEAGSWKPEAVSGKPKADSWKPEAGSWKLEAGSGNLLGRRGFDLDAPLHAYAPDAHGTIVVQAEELDRIELHVDAASGALITPGGQTALPAGSHLDSATGVFTWQPGAGFLGTYDLAFGARRVRVVLNPRGSNRVGVQTIVDAPAAGRVFPPGEPILVAGWAADLDSTIDTGVDTVHVWAYPVSPQRADPQTVRPIFLGAAAYGGSRPDVAAIYGARFEKSGYGIYVTGLAPGTYDIAVFAYSMALGRFAPARVVRVSISNYATPNSQ